ncbi:DNA glycosylase AlkZ-like family protein [Nocardia cyriacigeorgica]|uniref:DNA glycosylase AlkZ-like family protein n=1 Tax=Nocardia cyriacigeorgica TaxID=135487 RepID=UPI00245476E1|nr:crosslink repair DNA glycosylase YcaQ family protein [Nocardia cyriacigeorgica]
MLGGRGPRGGRGRPGRGAAGAGPPAPHDPYLRHTDRVLLVPDAERRKLIWRPVSAPGAVLDAGEVVGIWRYRRGENLVTVTGFEVLGAGLRRRIEHAAEVVTDAAGPAGAEIVFD